MKYFYVTYKNGLQNPTYVYAKDEVEARKQAYANHLKNSDFIGFIDLRQSMNQVVDTVTFVEDLDANKESK